MRAVSLLLSIIPITLSVAFIIHQLTAKPACAFLTKLGTRGKHTLSTHIRMADSDYAMRAQQFGFASDEAIREALQKSGTVVLDVRTNEEITTDGRIADSTTFPSDRLTYIQSDCTPTDCYTLRTSPQEIIPNVKTSTATIVIHCKSGRRAARAKDILIEHGYQGSILNAGGYSDVQKFFENK